MDEVAMNPLSSFAASCRPDLSQGGPKPGDFSSRLQAAFNDVLSSLGVEEGCKLREFLKFGVRSLWGKDTSTFHMDVLALLARKPPPGVTWIQLLGDPRICAVIRGFASSQGDAVTRLVLPLELMPQCRLFLEHFPDLDAIKYSGRDGERELGLPQLLEIETQEFKDGRLELCACLNIARVDGGAWKELTPDGWKLLQFVEKRWQDIAGGNKLDQPTAAVVHQNVKFTGTAKRKLRAALDNVESRLKLDLAVKNGKINPYQLRLRPVGAAQDPVPASRRIAVRRQPRSSASSAAHAQAQGPAPLLPQAPPVGSLSAFTPVVAYEASPRLLPSEMLAARDLIPFLPSILPLRAPVHALDNACEPPPAKRASVRQIVAAGLALRGPDGEPPHKKARAGGL